MKGKSLGLTVLLVASAGSALAQTQVSGTSNCGRPDASQPLEVGDQTGHVLVTEKGSCTWTVRFEMAVLKSTTYTIAGRYCPGSSRVERTLVLVPEGKRSEIMGSGWRCWLRL
jgi:hypothetical protein